MRTDPRRPYAPSAVRRRFVRWVAVDPVMSGTGIGARRRIITVPRGVAGIWGTMYVLVGLTGTRLTTTTLGNQWQLLPIDELSTRPIESTWFMHIQPPLWNLTIGMLERWSPLPTALNLQFVLLVCGMVTAGGITLVLQRMGVRTWAAMAIGLAVTLTGDVLFAGFRPGYELPTAALLVAVLVAVSGDWSKRPLRTALCTSAAVTALALTRGQYHPLFVVVVLAAVTWLQRAHLDRRRVLAAAALPVLLIGGWMAKNWVLFGTPTTSSWTGMNMLRSVQPAIDRDDLAALRANGTISDIGVAGAFLNYDSYQRAVDPCQPSRAAVLSLDMRTPPGTGPAVTAQAAPNFNYECYLQVFEVAGDDASAMIRSHPGAWLTARWWAANNWLGETPRMPAEGPLATGLARLSWLTEWRVPHPGLGVDDPYQQLWAHSVSINLVMLLATPVVALRGLARLWKRRMASAADQVSMLWITASLVTGWTVATSVLFELGEQERLRIPVTPIVLAFFAVTIIEASRSLLALQHRHAVTDGDDRATRPRVAGDVRVELS
jgi:hypothetical protein